MANIIEVMVQTQNYWNIQGKTLFHHAIAQYVTQKQKFYVSRVIRAKLYDLLGDPYDQDTFNASSNEDLTKCELTSNQITTLRNVSSVINEEETLEVNLNRLMKVSGMGPWTIKSIRLMLTNDNSIFLYEDYYIRSRLGELYNIKLLSPLQAKDIGLKWGMYQSSLSKFLWRIKTSGIEKIKSQTPLVKEDFL
jgi:3-methyladenine DNA glycosylase/8-oxoguanine DNA glycosylase